MDGLWEKENLKTSSKVNLISLVGSFLERLTNIFKILISVLQIIGENIDLYFYVVGVGSIKFFIAVLRNITFQFNVQQKSQISQPHKGGSNKFTNIPKLVEGNIILGNFHIPQKANDNFWIFPKSSNKSLENIPNRKLLKDRCMFSQVHL